MTELLEIVYAAVHSLRGVAVSTNAPERLRAKLYTVLKDEDISCLKLSIPAEPGKLWIVKKDAETGT